MYNNRMSIKLILVLGLFLSAFCNDHTIKDFLGGAFSLKPADGLYKINVGMSELNDGGNMVIAYGDFNGDKNVDLVTLSDDKLNVKIYLWNQEEGKFLYFKIFTVQQPVVSATAIDFNFDGLLDLMITIEDDKKFIHQIFLQEKISGFTGGQDPDIMFSGEKTQAMVVDLDGNHKNQILFVTKDEDSKVTRKLAYFDDSKERKFATKDFTEYISDGCLKYLDKNAAFADTHFNAFTDLNNDCKADLFIISKDSESNTNQMEFWIKQGDGKFCLKEFVPLKKMVKTVGFADIDFDGGIDMAVVEESSSTGSVQTIMNIYFNKNPPSQDALCGTSAQRYDTFPFDKYEETTNSPDVISFAMTQSYDSSLLLFSHNKNFPSMLRFADIDADTFPDLLVTLYDGVKEDSARAFVMSNVNCDQSFCDGKRHRRYFYLGKSANQYSLVSQDQSLHASFFDIGETGTMDLIISTKDKKTNSQSLIFIYNYLNPDTFFLKALGLNGSNEKLVGGIYYGTSFQCIITTLDGDWKISHVSQLTQSSNSALQTPFAYIGLGRTNNYVENLNVGMPQTATHNRAWTPIIPNSQLIVFPLQNDPTNWTVEIYVNPTKATVIVVISTVSILLVLGIVIIYLHRKEKEEDRKHQETFAFVVRY